MDSELIWSEPQSPTEIMDGVIEKYNYDRFYVLFSGGKDSVCVADFIAKNYPKQFAGIVFTNTGLGARDTRKFVIDYANKRGWKIHMTWASDKERFYNIVTKYGFAFAGNHSMWMGYLKMHTWYYFLHDKIKKHGENACFISGVRKKESRMRNKVKKYTKVPLDFNSGLPYVKPFLYKNGKQLWDYFIENDLEKTPVYEWLNRSGECYCGAHAEEWDLMLMKKHDPLAFESIKWLENEIQRVGTPTAKRYHKWGYNKTTDDIIHQNTITDFFGKEIEVNEDYCGESCVVDV
jgi:3'-phosphoadenosine 5'-phosphosulfate sulfotransferase (PAPS reductase)/FAD synthetase